MRSFKRASSSAWNEARREIWAMILDSVGSSLTRRSPVDDPMNTLIPAEPSNRSSAGISSMLVCVPPTKNAKSQNILCRARRTLSANVPADVVNGLVFGISNTAVTPPATAARLPVSKSSLCSNPGSRK